MSSQLITYLLEASVCLAVFYLFFRLILWKETFFVWNRVYIVGALLLSILIPAIHIPLQATQAAALQQVFVIQLQEATVAGASKSPAVSWQQMLVWIYLGVSGLLLLRLMFRMARLWYFANTFITAQIPEHRLILTNGKLPTFSFFGLFFWDNTQQLSEEARQQIVKHELTHIRQWHSADVVFTELVKAFLWFHPAVYLFKQALQQVHEYLADAAVVAQHPTGNYIQLLLSQVFHTQEISISTPFHQPPIKNRILMLQKLKQARPAFWKIALSLPIVVVLVFVYSCQKSEVEVSKPSSVTPDSKTTLTPEDILDKYRLKYPNIALEGVRIDEENSEIMEVMIKNVDNVEDMRKIEKEIIQAVQTTLKDSKKTVSPPPAALNSPDAPLADEIFQVVDEQPVPAEGYDAFFKYIGENITYPQQARLKGIEGKVFIQFIVYSDGSIGNVQVLKGIEEGCDEEAVKVIVNSPKWIPGKQDGKPVNVRMSVPIAFKLD